MNTRLSNVVSLLRKTKLDAALISSVPNIIYLTNFTSFSQEEREAFLLITKQNNYIFTDARYTHAVKKQVKKFILCEISSKSSFAQLLQELITSENIVSLGIEEDNLVIHEQKKIAPLVAHTKHFSLATHRMKKTTTEISLIQKACDIGDKAFLYILKKITIGMSEKEIALLLESFMRGHGATPSFPAIVAFQENAAIPHHKTGKRKLQKNELILMDFGVKYEEYCSDMTRTIFFGKANAQQKKAYRTVKEAQKRAKEKSLNQVQDDKLLASAVDKAAREYIISKGYPSIPHSLGHGIGLQVHEAPSLSPKSKHTLQEGMVFSIEPGIYVPDHFGVRIEDLFAIQDGKFMQLTKSPQELIEI